MFQLAQFGYLNTREIRINPRARVNYSDEIKIYQIRSLLLLLYLLPLIHPFSY